MTKEELDALYKLYVASTQGEWTTEPDAGIAKIVGPKERDSRGSKWAIISECAPLADAAWIAAVHNAWPEVERMLAEHALLHESLEHPEVEEICHDTERCLEVVRTQLASMTARAEAAEARLDARRNQEEAIGRGKANLSRRRVFVLEAARRMRVELRDARNACKQLKEARDAMTARAEAAEAKASKLWAASWQDGADLDSRDEALAAMTAECARLRAALMAIAEPSAYDTVRDLRAYAHAALTTPTKGET